MLEIPILFYLLVCIINFIFDKDRIVWFLSFIYFLITIDVQDPIAYFIFEYILQSFLFIIFGLLFYQNKLKMFTCLFLSFLSVINLFCFLYPTLYPSISCLFITITDRIYFETLLLISCAFINMKTRIISFTSILLVMMSYLI